MRLEKLHSRHRTASLSAGAIAISLLTGCASIPDVSVSYRPVKWALIVSAVHTITCNRNGDLALVERGATFTPVYSAAAPDERFKLRLKDLDRFYADADIAVSLTDDGRLKSVNAATTGQGEAVVKSAISAAATLAAAPVAAVAPAPGVNLFSARVFQKRIDDAKPATVCEVVRQRSLTAPDQLPQVSLIQLAVLPPKSGSSVRAAPSQDQQPLLDALKDARLDLTTTVTTSFGDVELQPLASLSTTVASDEVPLTLQRMRSFSVSVDDTQGRVGSKAIPVPTTDTFVLPVPKAALFGKQSFSMVLADSGRIVSLGYGRVSGVPGALGALTAVAGAEVTEDNAEAAALKAASDLIAQQQRFNNCKLKPNECK